MPLVEWNDKLAIGIAEVDAQHRKLVEMVNALHEAMKAGRSREMAVRLVEDLKRYAIMHFTTEERLMERYGFPELAAHQVEHNRFIEKVLDFDLERQEGAGVVPIEVMHFLRNWLTSHIQGTDRKYGPFLQAKGVK